MSDKPFLGTGWAFPPTFEKHGNPSQQTGNVALVSQRKDIEQSLQILLSTSLGERVLQPTFGCNLRDYQFEPLNASMTGFLKDLVETAILFHEARIELLNVEVSGDNSVDAIEGRFLISIEYEIRGVNSRYNFVYDFYRKEGVPNI